MNGKIRIELTGDDGWHDSSASGTTSFQLFEIEKLFSEEKDSHEVLAALLFAIIEAIHPPRISLVLAHLVSDLIEGNDIFDFEETILEGATKIKDYYKERK